MRSLSQISINTCVRDYSTSATISASTNPREIVFVDDLPKTATRKVRWASLRDREGLE